MLALATHHVVRGGHALCALAREVGVGLVGAEVERLGLGLGMGLGIGLGIGLGTGLGLGLAPRWSASPGYNTT